KDGTIYVTDFKNDRLQVFDADGSFITTLAGEATLSKWGRERVELDPVMVRGRQRAQGLEEREKPFQGPIAVDVDEEGQVFVGGGRPPPRPGVPQAARHILWWSRVIWNHARR